MDPVVILIAAASLALTFAGLLIALYKVNQASIQRSIENRIRIVALEKDIKEMKTEWSKDIDELKDTIKSNDTNNRKAHGKVFNELKKVSEGVATIKGWVEGWLKAKDND